MNFLHIRKKPFLECMFLPEMIACPVSFANKRAYWKLLKESQEFLATFSQLGVYNRINEDLVASLEKSVCFQNNSVFLLC